MTRGFGRVKSAAKRKNPGTNKHKMYVAPLIDSIIREADIILEVLDARFIEKSRNPEIEKRINELGKLLIYVFNKSDLVDTNLIRKNLEIEKIKPYLFLSSKDRKGSLNLRKLIKISANKLKKDKVYIGVVGYPNSGKSSLINYLIGKSSAKTSSGAGYTRGMQKLKLSQGIYLIDTPGIIPSSEKINPTEENTAKLQKIGAARWDKTKDPDMIVLKLMQEYPNVFEGHYKVDAKGDLEILLEKLGKKLSYLKKGGEIDEIRTAKKILKDWQEGKIRI